jgi:hypothetical protein
MPDTIPENNTSNHIGLVKESSLHAALKEWYFQPDDIIEKNVLGYYIDIVRGNQLIEIQTANFSAITTKISALLDVYPVHLVYPLPVQKWINKISPDGEKAIRKSPKKPRMEDIFWEIVKITNLINHTNFSLEILMVHVEEIWIPQQAKTSRSSWRRKGWTINDRKLINVFDHVVFNSPADYLVFLDKIPEELTFTSKDLAEILNIRRLLSQKIIYVLRKINNIQPVGKKGNALLYKRIDARIDK